MKDNKYQKAEYHVLTHERVKCYFTIIENSQQKKAVSMSIPNLTYTTIESTLLTREMSRKLGEILIKISDLLK